ncbi:MAG: recombinase family protein [Lachnospiraceae bacterium]|nr:recombinase family protein [Lachnospiraceae bacterium]
MPDQYCLYLRKSRADQEAEARGEGETLARHEHALLSFARSRHIHVSHIYREIVSGDTIASRPQMQKLLAEVAEGRWTGVLVMEIERLARGDTIDQGIMAQAFKISGTRILTPFKTYDPTNEFDEEYFEFGLFMSRREYKAINRRLSNGKLASIQEGKVLGGREPYGYRRVRIPNGKGCTLTIVPDQAEIVRTIFHLYAFGDSGRPLGYAAIAERLNLLCIPGPTGGSWGKETISGILQNPVYIGKVRFGNRRLQKTYSDGSIQKKRVRNPSSALLVDGLHPPLVERSVWDKVQKMRETRRPRVKSELTLKNPMAGLLICGLCGSPMTRSNRSGRNCATLRCKNPACPCVSSRQDIVEEKMLEGIRNWIARYRIPSAPEKTEDTGVSLLHTSLERIAHAQKQLLNQKERLYDLLERGTYDEDTFRSRMAKLNEKETELKRAASSAESELALCLETEDARAQRIPRMRHILEVYDSLREAEDKNALLKEIFERIEYVKESGGRWGDPEAFSLTLYPKLPGPPA